MEQRCRHSSGTSRRSSARQQTAITCRLGTEVFLMMAFGHRRGEGGNKVWAADGSQVLLCMYVRQGDGL